MQTHRFDMHIKLTLSLEQAQGTATRPRVPDTVDDGSRCKRDRNKHTPEQQENGILKQPELIWHVTLHKEFMLCRSHKRPPMRTLPPLRGLRVPH